MGMKVKRSETIHVDHQEAGAEAAEEEGVVEEEAATLAEDPTEEDQKVMQTLTLRCMLVTSVRM